MPDKNSPGKERLGMPSEDVLTATQLRDLRQQLGKYSSFGAITDGELAEWATIETGDSVVSPDALRLLSVIRTKGLRPLFDIEGDTFPQLATPWLALNQHRSFVERCIRASGRIDIPGHPLGLSWAGTGTVVGRQLLMTNRHVAEIFVRGVAPAWRFADGVSPRIDFRQESNTATSLAVRITRVILIHESWDIALLATEPLPNGIDPVPLTSVPPAEPPGNVVATIGYPGIDYSASAAELIEQHELLGGRSGTKRLQPGRTLGSEILTWCGKPHESLTHDCTTARGNSGSCVVDVERQRVVGIHFHGKFAKANYAVPVWRLIEDSRFAQAGTNFM